MLEVVMFVVTALVGIIQVLGVIILNNFNKKIDDMAHKVHELNNTVLGQYIRRDEVRNSIHEVRDTLQKLRSDVDTLMERTRLVKPPL